MEWGDDEKDEVEMGKKSSGDVGEEAGEGQAGKVMWWS